MIFDSKAFLKTLTTHPGIYKMLDGKGNVLYVGKARNLRNRVGSYFQKSGTVRIIRLVEQIHHIDILVTSTENEALLLENNLIKKLKPRYNIVFRDDKSYPYICLSSHSQYPRMDFHRGARAAKGHYFGPFPGGVAVRTSLHTLQKLFQLRSCSDHFFSNRSRPCIQYQIKRCSAPCVEHISAKAYQQNVDLAVLFLEGKNQQLMIELVKKMDGAAAVLDFEMAAKFRDQLTSLRQIHDQQSVVAASGDVDIIAAKLHAETLCVQVLFIRGGRMIGNHNFFSAAHVEMTAANILNDFIPQFYLYGRQKHDIPRDVLLNATLSDGEWLSKALSEAKGSRVKLSEPRRGGRMRWLKMAIHNASTALAAHLAGKAGFERRLQSFARELHLNAVPECIECFDISHTMGEATVASCVVFNREGADKSRYRRYNISGIRGGDDYGAMRQALMRRYTKMKQMESHFPDVVLIDGGKGQLRQAKDVFEELQITDVMLLGIAKGPGRKAEFDRVFQSHLAEPLQLTANSLSLHLLQQIRDEAHRFAIHGHRQQRDKKRRKSTLEGIEGVGAKRRQQLLNYFGGLQGLQKASAIQIATVPGISKMMAGRIFAYLHAAR